MGHVTDDSPVVSVSSIKLHVNNMQHFLSLKLPNKQGLKLHISRYLATFIILDKLISVLYIPNAASGLSNPSSTWEE